MKAIVYRKYGMSDVLQLEDVDVPIPKNDEVLVKVHASSINDWDWGLLRGQPYVNRIPAIRNPKYKILGSDIAGRIEAVGSEVERFKPGDEVLGDLAGNGWGGFAEYVCSREDTLFLKPESMSFEEAAAIPQAGSLGIQGVRSKSPVLPGQQVLINGAGGGAGTFAIQIAKLDGAVVTGVDSGEKLDTMQSVGADHVIDYTKEDFTKNGQQYDLIIDMAAHHSIFDYRRSLSPRGRYVAEGGGTGRIMQIVFVGTVLSLFGRKKMGLLLLKTNKGVPELLELYEIGKVRPVIDRIFPLSETAEAMKYFGDAHAKGKVVIAV